MRVTFGMYLDGARWSDGQAALGEVRLGPRGLLDLLESRLGLSGLSVGQAKRIDEYMKRVESRDSEDAWFHKSFAVDAWSTARQMLDWRDELVESGWDGRALDPSLPRLGALSDIESSDLPLSRGKSDRLRDAADALARAKAVKGIDPARLLRVSEVTLAEPLDLLPPIWRKIIKLLGECGAAVGQIEEGSGAEPGGGLSPLNAAMRGVSPSGVFDASADSPLTIFEAGDEWEAAENLAIWMSGGENDDVALICGSDTEILDRAFAARGLPKIGASETSRWRAATQLLPMLLSVVWRPVDAHRLAEFLSMPLCPIPPRYAWHLLRALTEAPGVGGSEWKSAIDSIEIDYVAYMEGKLPEETSEASRNKIKREARDYASWLDRILASDLCSADEGIPEEKLRELCHWLSERFLAHSARTGTGDTEKDPLIMEAIGHAMEMSHLAEGKGSIPRIRVERMLDSVIGEGSAAPDRFAEATPWRTFSHPGAVIGPVKTLIWWGFSEGSAPPRTYWSKTERSSLAKFGILPEPPFVSRQREASSWRRSFLNARERFMTFRPMRKDGVPLPPHPFLDEILCALGALDIPNDSPFIKNGESLRARGADWRLAGRSAALIPAGRLIPHAPIARHDIRHGAVPQPGKLSYTSVREMIACPMKWALKYQARLQKSRAFDLPTGNLMIGKLCHRIVQEIYTNADGPIHPDEAASAASRLYDSLLPSMASELLLEGREVERMRYRAGAVGAVRAMAEAIISLGMSVMGSETQISSSLDDIPFVGFADLILGDSSGNRFVFDLKWSGGDSHKRAEIEEGRAFQLATYAWMLRSEEANRGDVHTGYFMLAQGRLLSDSPLLGERAVVSRTPIDEVWKRGAASWRRAFSTLNGGVLEAKGVYEKLEVSRGADENELQKGLKERAAAEGLIYESPMCGWCDFAILCGVKGDSI
ncbi:MAG: PD-(D/E)XK nuclease family protein [Synergistaceae bacterium]|jgi:hypothetical protein|nr:PD-(D/E)XK nuclease family protein [Synergistaceae bacterium]